MNSVFRNRESTDVQVPISCAYPTIGGSKVGLRDGLKSLLKLLKPRMDVDANSVVSLIGHGGTRATGEAVGNQP